MPPARKRRRTCAPPVPVPELPACLLFEIAARSDTPTIFRCAATCKLFRREILSADFVRRVCHVVVPSSRTLCVLADTFSVVHPVTAATAALAKHFAQAAAGLLQRYEPLKSRHGLVVLCQRSLGWDSESDSDSERWSAADLCVYDPMANSRVFLPFAPDIDRELQSGVHLVDQCALLTAADGIGCSFMLVAADMARNNLDCASSSSSARVRVQTVSWPDMDAGEWSSWGWGPVKTIERHPCPRWCTNLDTHTDAAVVVSGVVHWLVHCGISSSSYLDEGVVGEYILTYDVKEDAVGTLDVPMDRRRPGLQREPAVPCRLASSPDGKLSFVVADHCTVFAVWVLSSSGEGSSWAQHVRIGMRAVLQPWMWMDRWVELESFFGHRSRSGDDDGAVLLRGVRFVLNMETGATCSTWSGGETGIPYVVDDLASRLASMKSF